MRYQPLNEVRAHADVAMASRPLSRKERLARWAQLLARGGSAPLHALRWVEFYAEPDRRRLRREGSPIEVAYADPVLRAAGLAGDTLGDAQAFFELSDDEAHRLLCDCHFEGRLTGRLASRRVGALARTGMIGHLARAFWR